MDDDYDVSPMRPRADHRLRQPGRTNRRLPRDGVRAQPHRVDARRPARRVVPRPHQLRRRRNALVDATIVMGTLAFLAAVGCLGMLIVHANLPR
jgi:hypothetical protein